MSAQPSSDDPVLIDKIVNVFLSCGKFDKLRRECMADVDTKPAYLNLQHRVEAYVTTFLRKQNWKPDLNKNQIRDYLRKNVSEAGFLDPGINRIVEQVMNSNVLATVFKPEVEEVVFKYLGINKPSNGSPQLNGNNETEQAEETELGHDLSKVSNDSQLSGMSELTSHGSNLDLSAAEGTQEALTPPGTEVSQHSTADSVSHHKDQDTDSDASVGLAINESSLAGPLNDSDDESDSIRNKMSPISLGAASPEQEESTPAPVTSLGAIPEALGGVPTVKRDISFLGRIPKLKKDSEPAERERVDVMGNIYSDEHETKAKKPEEKTSEENKKTTSPEHKKPSRDDKRRSRDRQRSRSRERKTSSSKGDRGRSRRSRSKSRDRRRGRSRSKDRYSRNGKKQRSRSAERRNKRSRSRDKEDKSHSCSGSRQGDEHKHRRSDHSRKKDSDRSSSRKDSRQDRRDEKDKRSDKRREKNSQDRDKDKNKSKPASDDHGRERVKKDSRRSNDRDSNDREDTGGNAQTEVKEETEGTGTVKKEEKETDHSSSQKEEDSKGKDKSTEVEAVPTPVYVTPSSIMFSQRLTSMRLRGELDLLLVRESPCTQPFLYFTPEEAELRQCEVRFKRYVDSIDPDHSPFSSDDEELGTHVRDFNETLLQSLNTGLGNIPSGLIYDHVTDQFYRKNSRTSAASKVLKPKRKPPVSSKFIDSEESGGEGNLKTSLPKKKKVMRRSNEQPPGVTDNSVNSQLLLPAHSAAIQSTVTDIAMEVNIKVEEPCLLKESQNGEGCVAVEDANQEALLTDYQDTNQDSIMRDGSDNQELLDGSENQEAVSTDGSEIQEIIMTNETEAQETIITDISGTLNGVLMRVSEVHETECVAGMTEEADGTMNPQVEDSSVPEEAKKAVGTVNPQVEDSSVPEEAKKAVGTVNPQVEDSSVPEEAKKAVGTVNPQVEDSSVPEEAKKAVGTVNPQVEDSSVPEEAKKAVGTVNPQVEDSSVTGEMKDEPALVTDEFNIAKTAVPEKDSMTEKVELGEMEAVLENPGVEEAALSTDLFKNSDDEVEVVAEHSCINKDEATVVKSDNVETTLEAENTTVNGDTNSLQKTDITQKPRLEEAALVCRIRKNSVIRPRNVKKPKMLLKKETVVISGSSSSESGSASPVLMAPKSKLAIKQEGIKLDRSLSRGIEKLKDDDDDDDDSSEDDGSDIFSYVNKLKEKEKDRKEQARRQKYDRRKRRAEKLCETEEDRTCGVLNEKKQRRDSKLDTNLTDLEEIIKDNVRVKDCENDQVSVLTTQVVDLVKQTSTEISTDHQPSSNLVLDKQNRTPPVQTLIDVDLQSKAPIFKAVEVDSLQKDPPINGFKELVPQITATAKDTVDVDGPQQHEFERLPSLKDVSSTFYDSLANVNWTRQQASSIKSKLQSSLIFKNLQDRDDLQQDVPLVELKLQQEALLVKLEPQQQAPLSESLQEAPLVEQPEALLSENLQDGDNLQQKAPQIELEPVQQALLPKSLQDRDKLQQKALHVELEQQPEAEFLQGEVELQQKALQVEVEQQPDALLPESLQEGVELQQKALQVEVEQQPDALLPESLQDGVELQWKAQPVEVQQQPDALLPESLQYGVELQQKAQMVEVEQQPDALLSESLQYEVELQQKALQVELEQQPDALLTESMQDGDKPQQEAPLPKRLPGVTEQQEQMTKSLPDIDTTQESQYIAPPSESSMDSRSVGSPSDDSCLKAQTVGCVMSNNTRIQLLQIKAMRRTSGHQRTVASPSLPARIVTRVQYSKRRDSCDSDSSGGKLYMDVEPTIGDLEHGDVAAARTSPDGSSCSVGKENSTACEERRDKPGTTEMVAERETRRGGANKQAVAPQVHHLARDRRSRRVGLAKPLRTTAGRTPPLSPMGSDTYKPNTDPS